MAMTKSKLAIALSRLRVFGSPDESLEQYPTDSEIAAQVLWDAYMKGDISGKDVADFGAGTGILGIGALLLGAKKVFFVEHDRNAILILRKNLEMASYAYDVPSLSYEIIEADISVFGRKVDTVLQNPPFGTREKHADKAFLEKAFSCADSVYSFHKTSTKDFVLKISETNGFFATEAMDFSFPLRKTLSHHKKNIHRIDVSCFRLTRA